MEKESGRVKMGKMTLRLLWVSAVINALAFLFFIVVSFNQFSQQLFELSFRGAWSVDNSLISLSAYFLALQCSAILICYSLFYRPTLNHNSSSVGPFYKLVMYSLILFLISALIGFLLQELAVPGAWSRQYERMEETRISRDIYMMADKAEKEGDPEGALELYKRLSFLQPENRDALIIKQGALEQQITDDDGYSDGLEKSVSLLNKAPAELLSEARSYEINEDFFSAYYYSSLAFQIDNQFFDAREFASKMWDKIESNGPMREEMERTYVFNRKKEGTTLLSSGRSVDAFYLFLSLKTYIEENALPEDSDVDTYLELSRQACLEVSYFHEDTVMTISSPGYHDIFFRNRDEVNNRNHTEIIMFGKAVPHLPSWGMWMVQDIRVLRYNNDELTYSLTAPFGKITLAAESSRGKLILHGISNIAREDNYHAEYTGGEERLELDDVVPIYIDSKQLEALAEEKLGYVMTNLMWLWESRGLLEEAGFGSEPIHQKILEKVLYPFSFIIFCLLSVTFGWRLRQRSGPPAVATFLIFPFLPLLIHGIHELYMAANVSLLSFVQTMGGFVPSFIFLLILQAILLFFSFILLAGQRSS